MVKTNPEFSDAYSFKSLYDAHILARRGKRDRREVIDFELDLGRNIARLSKALADGTYQMQPYTRFMVTDPKRRYISALGYRDRVVQHSLCDNVVGPLLEPRLICDNTACRVGRGTSFALDRLELFLKEHYRVYGHQGYFLKCDIYHFFASINHTVLKDRLTRVPFDIQTRDFLFYIINSYEDSAGCGVPLGNQTSQWFALYYLDVLDRLVKENLHIRGYVRYMDDAVLLHHSKRQLKEVLDAMSGCIASLGLEFNSKTQITPLYQGIDFLGWHLYLTQTGKVVRRLRAQEKRRICGKMARIKDQDTDYANRARQSYCAYLSRGDTKGLLHSLQGLELH